MATKPRLTAEDLWQMPDDGVPRELVDGEIVEMPRPLPPHGRLVSLIDYYLVDHVKKHGGGEVVGGDVGFVLTLSYDPERVRGVDIAFVSTERLPGGKLPEKWFRGAPDLAVEILSPSNTSVEIQQKVRDYLEDGARLVWVLAHQVKTATVYRADGTASFLREKDVLEGEDVLPGLRIPLVDLFR